MKIKIFSDIILNPFVDELKSLNPQLEIEFEYKEELISAISSISKSELNVYDYLFIHIDCFFNKRDKEYQSTFFDVMNNFAGSVKPITFLSNAVSEPFPFSPLNKSFGQTLQYLLDNKAQIEFISSNPNLVFFDFQHTLFTVGFANAYNYNLGHLYQMPYTKKTLKQFALDFNQLLNFYSDSEKKVIILDCDNTLWKGVLGEDGIDGVECNLNSNGIIHFNFQKFLKERKEEGFLLCLCSKNNEADVHDIFVQKSMPLKWDDFIIKKINWKDKFENIIAIKTELNLGLDSCIFIDDSDFEINSVKTVLNELTVFKFSSNYDDFVDLVQNLSFRKKIISEEDKEKTKQYQEEFLRKNEMLASATFEDYIEKLQIKLDLRVNDINDFERLSQLTEKTNQFNFNKKHFSVQNLHDFIYAGKGIIYSLRVSDKYGDYGTTGIVLVTIDQANAIIENFIMSCRILGRRIENNFLTAVVNDLHSKKIKIDAIKFNETAKNKPAKDFLQNLEYEVIN
jgi:FkbH-like protein